MLRHTAGDHVKIYKTFLPKVTLQIGKKKLLELKRLKILYRGHVISDLMESSPPERWGQFYWVLGDLKFTPNTYPRGGELTRWGTFLLKVFFPEQYYYIKGILICKMNCNLKLKKSV